MDGNFLKILPLRAIDMYWSSSLNGYFSEGIVKISTEIFIKYVVLNLVDVLYVANKHTNRDGKVKWRIIISKLSINILISLVCPYFIP